MLHFILGTAGSGKTWRMRELIKQQADRGESGIMLLVPEQNNYESERAMLRLLGSASTEKAEVVSFTMIARDISQNSGMDALQSADDGIKMLMMGRAVADAKSNLTAYRNSCDSAEFCSAMLNLDAEMKRNTISADEIKSVSSSMSGAVKNKCADISLILGTYHGLLDGRFSDPLDDMMRLDRVLNEKKYFCGKTVYIDAFKGFTEQQYRVLNHILAQAKDVFVSVCADGINDYDKGYGLFSNTKNVISRLTRLARDNSVSIASPETVRANKRFGGTVIERAEQVLREKTTHHSDAENNDEGEDKKLSGKITVCSCTNVYDEADYIARNIRKIVRTEGYRYRDFAVVARDIDSCRSALIDAFERYRVPCFSDERIDADSLELFRLVMIAVDCVVGNFSNEIMLRYVKNLLSPITVEQASELEKYALMWKKSGDDWFAEWTENPNGYEKSFDKPALERINSARKAIVMPLESLKKAFAVENVSSMSRGIYEFLIKAKADKKLSNYADELERNGSFRMADAHRQSWDALMVCLDNAVRALSDDYCTAREFSSLFSLLIMSCNIGSIPDRIDEVVIGSADRIRIGNPKITFIIGANYGTFPMSERSSGLLTAEERRRLIKSGLSMPDFEREGAVDEQYYVYTTVCSPSERLYITYHISSLGGESDIPSEFIAKLQKGVPQTETVRSCDSEQDRFEGVLPTSELVSNQKYRKYARSVYEQFEKRGLSAASAVKYVIDGRTEMKLSPENAGKLFGRNIRMSATKVETYAKCPFMYFCNYGLGVEPDKTAEFDAAKRGSMIHYVLEKAVGKHGKSISELTADERREEIRQLIREYSDEQFGGYDGLDRSFLIMLDRILLMLDGLIEHIGEEFDNSDFAPDKVELGIGDEIPSVNVPLDEGSIVLNGKIDRVDVFRADGKTYVRVVDYKSGSKEFDISEIFGGFNMQMLIYLFTVIGSGMYDNAEAAGVLYQPAKRTLSLTDKNDEKASDEAKIKSFRMNGLLVNNPSVLNAMEHGNRGVFIPCENGKKGLGGSLIGADEFNNIQKLLIDELKKMGNEIHNGRIAVDPVDGSKNACEYCKYHSICLADKTAPHKTIEKMNLKTASLKLKGES